MPAIIPVSASDLYAQALGCKNEGTLECHWCASHCDQRWPHTDDLPIPFIKSRSRAKRPANGYVCRGCWLWGRKSTTIMFLDDSWCDRQWAVNHSWWITAGCARAVRQSNFTALYELLIKPPHQFMLALVTPGMPNHLHCAVANDLVEVQAGTPLRFTLDNLEMSYTVAELLDAMTGSPTGKEPGTQALVRYLGAYLPPTKTTAPKEEERGRGRPPAAPDAKSLGKLIAKSGVLVS